VTERYALYSTFAGLLFRMRVRHPRWPLHDVRIGAMAETVARASGLAVAGRPALAHFSDGVDVEVLPPEPVRPERAASTT
jgi:uncharacterized protein YqjF (DUF2071 family)